MTPRPATRRSLPIALLRARERVMEPIRAMLAQSGVSEQKWRVLRVLEESGPMDLTRLAAEACLLLPSLTRMLPALLAEGLVARQPDPADRRRAVIAIAPPGRALLDRPAEESAAIFARIEAEFGPERLQTLLDLLDDLRSLRGGRDGLD